MKNLKGRIKKLEEKMMPKQKIVLWHKQEMGKLTEKKKEDLREAGMQILIIV